MSTYPGNRDEPEDINPVFANTTYTNKKAGLYDSPCNNCWLHNRDDYLTPADKQCVKTRPTCFNNPKARIPITWYQSIRQLKNGGERPSWEYTTPGDTRHQHNLQELNKPQQRIQTSQQPRRHTSQEPSTLGTWVSIDEGNQLSLDDPDYYDKLDEMQGTLLTTTNNEPGSGLKHGFEAANRGRKEEMTSGRMESHGSRDRPPTDAPPTRETGKRLSSGAPPEQNPTKKTRGVQGPYDESNLLRTNSATQLSFTNPNPSGQSLSYQDTTRGPNYVDPPTNGPYRFLIPAKIRNGPPRLQAPNQWAMAFPDPCNPCKMRNGTNQKMIDCNPDRLVCWNNPDAEMPLNEFKSSDDINSFYHNRKKAMSRVKGRARYETQKAMSRDKQSESTSKRSAPRAQETSYDSAATGKQRLPQKASAGVIDLTAAPDIPRRAVTMAEVQTGDPNTITPSQLQMSASQPQYSRIGDPNALTGHRVARHNRELEESARAKESRKRGNERPPLQSQSSFEMGPIREILEYNVANASKSTSEHSKAASRDLEKSPARSTSRPPAPASQGSRGSAPRLTGRPSAPGSQKSQLSRAGSMEFQYEDSDFESGPADVEDMYEYYHGPRFGSPIPVAPYQGGPQHTGSTFSGVAIAPSYQTVDPRGEGYRHGESNRNRGGYEPDYERQQDTEDHGKQTDRPGESRGNSRRERRR